MSKILPNRNRATPALDDAVSLHTTNGAYDEDAPEIDVAPPPYTDEPEAPEFASSSTALQSSIQDAHPIDADNTFPSPIRAANGVAQYMSPRLSTEPDYLQSFITTISSVPPQQSVLIEGKHTETVRKSDGKGSETKHITDFSITLDLSQTLRHHLDRRSPSPESQTWMTLRTVENSEKAHRGTVLRKRAPGYTRDIEVGPSPKPSLKEWCHLYCASHSSLRTFSLERRVTGLDTKRITLDIEHLLRSTGYRGHISVTFPINNKTVEVHNANWQSKWRLTLWIRWVFFLTFLWIFTWPYLFFATKKFAVVRAEWPFSLVNGSNGQTVYATVSEAQWLDKWAALVKVLAVQRFQGEASEGQLRSLREDPAQFSSGNAHVDGVVNLLGSGLRGLGEVRRGMDQALGWGADC